MLKSTVDSIKDYIIQYNPYFKKGYSDVYLDEKTGIIHNSKPIFPADNLGDYFYLRLPNKVQFDYAREFQISDCISGAGIRASVILVAVVKDADPDKLIQNLVNTLQTYQNVNVNSAIYLTEDVIIQELAKTSEETIMAALQRMKSTIVSLTFTILTPYQFKKLSCIENPCKCS